MSKGLVTPGNTRVHVGSSKGFTLCGGGSFSYYVEADKATHATCHQCRVAMGLEQSPPAPATKTSHLR